MCYRLWRAETQFEAFEPPLTTAAVLLQSAPPFFVEGSRSLKFQNCRSALSESEEPQGYPSQETYPRNHRNETDEY